MIKVTDDNQLEITGNPLRVLGQIRALVDSLSEVEELEPLFQGNLDFFNPRASNADVRNIIDQVIERCEKKAGEDK